jgi:ABC-type glycerol-3-phosphate transport system substrate-binding protein
MKKLVLMALLTSVVVLAHAAGSGGPPAASPSALKPSTVTYNVPNDEDVSGYMCRRDAKGDISSRGTLCPKGFHAEKR